MSCDIGRDKDTSMLEGQKHHAYGLMGSRQRQRDRDRDRHTDIQTDRDTHAAAGHAGHVCQESLIADDFAREAHDGPYVYSFEFLPKQAQHRQAY